MRRARRRLALVLTMLLAACFPIFHSQDSLHRAARRDCLAAARARGWQVQDIGEARSIGSGQLEVQLTVERDSVPQRTLRCVYYWRDGATDFPDEAHRD